MLTAQQLTPPTDVILVADADADARQIYTKFFRYHGYQVVPVTTCRDALAAAPAVDAIVAEILLPGEVDGLDLIEQLKSDIRTASIPLVVVTSRAWTTDRERAYAAGCDLFLAKPCLPNDLMQTVRRLLARRKLQAKPPIRARHGNHMVRTWRTSGRSRTAPMPGEPDSPIL